MPDGGDIEKVVIGNATLYLGNCLQVLATLKDKVNHTLTDPPYEEEAHSSGRQVQRTDGLAIEALDFEAMDDATRYEVTRYVSMLTKGWAMYFCQVEANNFWRIAAEKAGAKYFSTMAWIKPDGKPNYRGNGPGIGFENIVLTWCSEGKSTWNGGGRNGVLIANKNEDKDEFNTHLTVKPQKLMRELVTLFTNKDEIILDCFCGSGSTGVAAVTLGRRFIGIERDPKYFEVACRRIEEAQAGGLINTHYVKTKAKLTAPLLADAFEKKQPVIAPKKAKAKKVDNKLSTPSAIKRPMITIGASSKSVVSGAIDRKAFAAAAPVVKRPFIDPFLAFHQQTLAAAGAEPMKFDHDSWDWDAKSAVGFDVECYQNFFLVCFKRFSDGKRITFERSERADIDVPRLEHILHNNLLISFNGDNYDIPMIFYALKGKGANCVELKHASDRIIKTGMKRWDVVRELGVAIPKINHIDLMEPNPSVRQSLKILGGRLHQRFLVDLPYNEDARLDRRQMNFTTCYCFNDIETNQILYEALKEPLELRVALSREYNIDMRSKSDAQVGEAIIKKRVETETGKQLGRADSIPSSFRYTVPPFISFEDDRLNALLGELSRTDFHLSVSGKVETPKALDNLKIEIGDSVYTMGIGGLHSNEENRAVLADENNIIVDADVASQYPSIIMKLGLYPKAVGPIYLEIGKQLIAERLEAKRTGDKVKSEGGKIALNGGLFGKLGSPYSFLYAPHLLIAVTLTGQLSLLMLIERFEAEGIKVVSGNTDGVVALCPRDKEPLLQELVKKWEAATGFQAEQAHYKAIYNSSVNTYIAIKEDGKVKRKGPIANPWADHDTRGQLSKNPQMSVISDAVLSYIQNGTPIEDSIRSCTDPRAFVTIINVKGGGKWRNHKLGRVVRYYWSLDGEPITYVSNDKQVAKSDGARPAMEIPETLWDDINYDKYIEEAKKLAVDLAVIEEERKGLL